MQHPPSPPPPSPPSPSSFLQPRVSEMAIIPHQLASYEPPNSLWDWSDFLDFDIDEQLSIPFDSDHPPATHLPIDLPPIVPIQASSSDNSDKVRKRDPRLTCSNFLAGRIPCACPELDEKLAAEEEESGPGKKRARTFKASSGMARCQVPGCEADISELKGYHRRHRVCLRCANASHVVLDGQSKRYCQQCGKFHILSDFDEGKRSCRRKLERHNNRRRRKPADSKEAPEKEPQQVLLAEDVGCDDGAVKDSVCLNSKATEGETLLESEEHISILCSARGSENIQNDSFVSFVASGEAQIDEGKENCTNSPSYCDNKSALSSMCPTGRISFKLYDWNPAEFPRRLRHQIFQWLSSMPVELEGYIRPGCTILTVFIAMPKFMWVKLFEDPIVYINDLVGPGNMLFGRGTFLVYLNNMIFRVMKDGTSVIKVKAEGQAPKLHYVHPTCFEAGKPMEFVACGSNLLQPKFRFLVSFAGKYLTYDVCVQPPCNKTGRGAASNFDHQLLKIFVPHTEQNIFGPAFIEVENESGLSNFIPILIGDKEICSEMKIMQHQFNTSLRSKGSQFAATSSSCEVSVLRQKELSEFILHVAWLLKEPASENKQHILTYSQLQRLNCLLDFLIETESTAILERVLYHMKIVMNNSVASGIADADMRLYQRNINHASDIFHKKMQKKVNSVLVIRNIAPREDFCIQSSKNDPCSVVPATNQNTEVIERSKLDAVDLISSRVPLLNGDVVMSVNLIKEREWPRKSCSPLFTSTVLTSRPLIFAIAATAACFGICAVVLHPQRVGEIATTIRRCLFNNQR